MADAHSAGTKSEPMKFGTLSLADICILSNTTITEQYDTGMLAPFPV